MEIHLVHSCNFSCESCSHYSNQGHKGILALEEADEWMRLWNQRLHPVMFTLLGGEPTIHPRLADFVVLARKNWPDSRLNLITNGSFLHRHPDLPAALKATATSLTISIHHDSAEYQVRMRPALQLATAWQKKHGFELSLWQSFAKWTRRYRGTGAAMEPFEDKQPRKSWEICPARYCRQLFEGKIWKCGPVAYLKMQVAKYGLAAAEKWQPYLRYRPLEPACTEAELNAFFDREEELHCSMCSAYPRPLKLPLPLPERAASAATEKPGTAAPLRRTPLQVVASWFR